ncbi:MAG TPA: polymer-forming cytoskeletal protein, partial [Thermomicrobiales bacterium]|nr:polymer-forming cytoskeletal protein [Thermomicrobiales bacterium]
MTMRTDSQYEGEQETYSVIDRNSVFDGVFQTTRNLRVEGEVKGTIDCKGTLFVAEGATVAAKVEADNVSVAGDLNGEIRCRGRLQIMPSGKVRGKVNTQTLVINEGALYEGQLEMTAPETPAVNAGLTRTMPASEQKPPVAISTAASRAAATEPVSSTFIRRLG